MDSGYYYHLLERGFIKEEDREPDVTGLDFYLDAFGELSTSRNIGLAVGPIPFTSIAEYFRIYELEDFEEFAYVIRRLDCVFLELNAESASSQENKGNGGNRDKATGNRS